MGKYIEVETGSDWRVGGRSLTILDFSCSVFKAVSSSPAGAGTVGYVEKPFYWPPRLTVTGALLGFWINVSVNFGVASG